MVKTTGVTFELHVLIQGKQALGENVATKLVASKDERLAAPFERVYLMPCRLKPSANRMSLKTTCRKNGSRMLCTG
jgi:hypothetical protein